MNTPLIPCWVHALDDYRAMFDLTDQMLHKSILDYPAGISSFNAELAKIGHTNVVSADASYHLAPLDMVKHVDLVIQGLSDQLDSYIHHLQLEDEASIGGLLNGWHKNAQTFLSDYATGREAGRYCVAKLPELPFPANKFDLALCSDMVFRQTDFTPNEVLESLVRVAHEVRVFPLLNAAGEISAELGPLMMNLQQMNFGIEVKEVPYKLMKKSNAMLRIWVQECVVS